MGNRESRCGGGESERGWTGVGRTVLARRTSAVASLALCNACASAFVFNQRRHPLRRRQRLQLASQKFAERANVRSLARSFARSSSPFGKRAGCGRELSQRAALVGQRRTNERTGSLACKRIASQTAPKPTCAHSLSGHRTNASVNAEEFDKFWLRQRKQQPHATTGPSTTTITNLTTSTSRCDPSRHDAEAIDCHY